MPLQLPCCCCCVCCCLLLFLLRPHACLSRLAHSLPARYLLLTVLPFLQISVGCRWELLLWQEAYNNESIALGSATVEIWWAR